MTELNNAKVLFAFAKKFLIRELKCPDAGKIIESYLSMPDKSRAPVSIRRIYLGLLGSAQNANMTASVIGGSLDGGVDSLGKVLFDFDPAKVAAAFNGDPERLLDEIIKVLKPRGQIRKAPPEHLAEILPDDSFRSDVSESVQERQGLQRVG